MSNNVKLLKKGFYSHPQAYGLVQVRHFMYTQDGDTKCLNLRFSNEAQFTVYAMEFVLTEMNSKGETIRKDRVCVDNVKFFSGKMHALKQAIVVDKACVDFTVHMLWIRSKNYKYTFERGQPVAHFDPRGFDSKGKKEQIRSGAVDISQKRPGFGRLGWVMLPLFILLAALSSACAIAYEAGMFDAIIKYLP